GTTTIAGNVPSTSGTARTPLISARPRGIRTCATAIAPPPREFAYPAWLVPRPAVNRHNSPPPTAALTWTGAAPIIGLQSEGPAMVRGASGEVPAPGHPPAGGRCTRLTGQGR